jgi:hypothetical protein
MTRDDIPNLPAGPVMDEIVSRLVMGDDQRWAYHAKISSLGRYVIRGIIEEIDWYHASPRSEYEYCGPKYSTNIGHAWSITKKFPYVYLFKADMALGNMQEGQWECKLCREDRAEYYAVADTAEVAMCRAALLAVIGIV